MFRLRSLHTLNGGVEHFVQSLDLSGDPFIRVTITIEVEIRHVDNRQLLRTVDFRVAASALLYLDFKGMSHMATGASVEARYMREWPL